MKHEVFILGGQKIIQKRKKGWRRGLGEMRKGRRERIEKGSKGQIEIERKEKETKGQFEEEEHHHLPLLVIQNPQGTAVLL